MEPLIVPAVLDSLGTIGRYVLDAAAAVGLDKRASYRLRLAVDEIATNIIDHGYGESGKSGDVVVRADILEDELAITLEDTATPFDPRTMSRPEQIDMHIEDRPVGGLGVFLALEGVDEFSYEYDGERNRNIFVMKRPAPGPGIDASAG